MNREIESSGSNDPGPSEEELFGLFERRRPNAASFAERLDARIKEREAAESADGSGDAVESTPMAPMGSWSKAAALLPLHTTGLKIIPAALAWPLLLIVATVSGFVYGRRSLSKSLREAEQHSGEQQHQDLKHKKPISVKWLSALMYFGVLAPLFLGHTWGGEVILVAVLLGMLGLTFVVRDLAAVGTVTRVDLATAVVSGLILLLVSGSFFGSAVSGGAVYAGPTRGWSFVVLVASIITCLRLSGDRSKARGFALWGLFVLLVLNPFTFTRSSPAAIRSQLDYLAEDLRVKKLGHWKQAASLHGALVAAGEDTPDLSDLAARVTARVDDIEDVHPTVWNASIAMGLLTPEALAGLAESHRRSLDSLMRKVDRRADGGELRGLSMSTYHHYRVALLLHAEDLDDRSRAALVDLVLELWPSQGDFHALEAALGCVKLLELLGEEEKVESLRGPAVELLAAYWMAPARAGWLHTAGGFMAQPVEFQASFKDATLQAVELMARFGIPAGVDPFLLRGYLRQESASFLPLPPTDYLKAESRAALLQLEEQVGMPQRTWLEWFVAQRLFIVVTLLAALCISAVWIAPRSIEQILEDEVGAQP